MRKSTGNVVAHRTCFIVGETEHTFPTGKTLSKTTGGRKVIMDEMQTPPCRVQQRETGSVFFNEILVIGAVETQVGRNEQRDHSECAGNISGRM